MLRLIVKACCIAACFGNFVLTAHPGSTDTNLLADNGNEYWVDPKTGESTWYMPEEFGWAPVDDREVGRLFYHNSVTKVSPSVSLVLHKGTNQACNQSLTAPDLPAGISMGEARDPGLAEDCCAQGGPVNPPRHALSWEAVQVLNAYLV